MSEHQRFAEGDIVDHKVFGLGKVTAVNDRGYTGAGASTGSGYPVSVIWDDPTRRETTVMHWALRKVSSPDVRPYIFWDKQWQPLREQWLKARRDVEQLCATFEPDWRKLDGAFDAEEEVWVKVREFINTPRT
jgi:hypothetical protein